MTQVDFYHLMEKGNVKRHLYHCAPIAATTEIYDIIKQDELSTRVYFIVNGECQVWRDGEVITECGPGFFLGEMGFVKWRAALNNKKRNEIELIKLLEYKMKKNRTDDEISRDELQSAMNVAAGTVLSPSGFPIEIMNDNEKIQIQIDKYNRNLEDNRAGAAGLRAGTVGDDASTDAPALSNLEKQYTKLEIGEVNFNEKGVIASAGVRTSPIQPPLSFSLSNKENNTNIENSGNCDSISEKKLKQGDVLLYSWSFEDLNKILCEKGTLALVLERAFSADLQKKIRRNDIKVKYKYVLIGAMSNLTVEYDPITKLRIEKLDSNTINFVKSIQKELGVTEEVHASVLKDLNLSPSMFANVNANDINKNKNKNKDDECKVKHEIKLKDEDVDRSENRNGNGDGDNDGDGDASSKSAEFVLSSKQGASNSKSLKGASRFIKSLDGNSIEMYSSSK
jgi:hypothetical protein